LVRCNRLKLVVVLGKVWDLNRGAALALADGLDEIVKLVAFTEGITGHESPVIEHTLWESLAGSGGTEVGDESEGLEDRKVGVEVVNWGTWTLVLGEDVATLLVKAGVDTSEGTLWGGDVHEEDRLHEGRGGGEHAGVHATTSSRHDLAGTTVNGIGVHGDVVEVVTDATHWLLSERTLLGGPLEGGDNVVLDLVEVLDTDSVVDENVRTGSVWAETPDLAGEVNIPAEVVGEHAGAALHLLGGGDDTVVDGEGELLTHRLSAHEKTVVLVRRLGETHAVGLLSDGLTEGDNRVTLDDWGSLHEVLLKILEANLKVKLTGTGNNVLTGLGGETLDNWVGLGKTLETLDELWKIGGVLWANGLLDNRGDGVLHHLDVVGDLVIGNGTGLKNVGVDTDDTDGVTTWDIVDGLGLTSHHDGDTLDVLDVKVLLLAREVVRSHDAGLLASLDLTGENATEGDETGVVRGWHHLGDVNHESTIWVTFLHGLATGVIDRSLVESLGTVGLGLGWGWEVKGDHLEERLGGWEPLAHDGLDERLLHEVLLIGGESNTDHVDELGVLLLVVVHDELEHLEDWLEDELTETTDKRLAGGVGTLLLGPLTGLDVEEVVTPHLLHELLRVSLELGGVEVRKVVEGECPGLETGTESDGAKVREDLAVTEGLVVVGCNDDVGVLKDLDEVEVGVLKLGLELENDAVHLVNHDNWLDTLLEGLTEHGLGLHTDTLDTVHDDEGTISDTESGGHLGGEVNVPRGVDEVDEETTLGIGLRIVLVNERLDGLAGLEVKGDTGGLNGNTTVLLILTGVSVALVTGIGGGDNTGLGDEGVRKGGLTVVDVSDHGHVTDVVRKVHDLTHLVDGKVWHFCCVVRLKSCEGTE